MSELLKKITDLTAGTPADTDIIPYVDLVSGETKKALKSELKGDTGLAATADAGTTTTLAAGQNATVTNVGTINNAIFDFAIPQGIQGITGATGAKVISVAFSGNDIVFTLDDSSTVTLTNAKIDLKGDKGDNGSDGTNGVDGAVIVSGAFSGDDLVFTLSNSSTATVIGAKTDLRGIQGIQGIPGATGNGISNISLISTVGLVKTYRITYTDSTTFDYTVTDGANGTGTLSSIVAGTNISIDNTDANNPVINNTQDISGKEDVSNKKTSLADNSNTFYPTQKAVKTAIDAKQDTLDFTPENSANKENTTINTSTTKYPTVNLLKTGLDAKASLTGTETLTNKRINPRVISATSYTTDTGTSLNVATCDQFEITAQAGDLKLNNLSGTPVGGQKIIIRIKDNGTSRALTYDTQYRAIGVTLPTATTVNKTLYLGGIWNATDTKLDIVAVALEA